MIPYKGKTLLKQYILSKPQKLGYKFFVSADDKSVMYDSISYTGKINPGDDKNVPDLKASSKIVLHLDQCIPSQHNHLLFFYNWFTPFEFLAHLASRGIWCCGTIRVPRIKGLSKKMINNLCRTQEDKKK